MPTAGYSFTHNGIDTATLMDRDPDQVPVPAVSELQMLRQKANRYDRFTRNIPALLYDYVIDADGTGRCLYCSAYSQELLGIAPEEFLADMNRFWSIIHPDDLDYFREQDQKASRSSDRFFIDTRVILSSGEEKWIRISSTKSPSANGEPAIWSGYMIDISQTKRQEMMLHEQATHDFLTGLGNRNYFKRHFQSVLQQKDPYQSDGVVLLLDLDHFKLINDKYGHDAGDYVLKQVANIIRAQLRNIDIVARWGGEEFCILLPNTTPGQALLAAERIRSNLARRPLDYQGQLIRVTTSIGLTTLIAGDMQIEAALRRADQALYRSKHRGRNQVTCG